MDIAPIHEMQLSKYTSEQIQAIQRDTANIYDALTRRKSPRAKGQQKLIAVLGPPGSGKSTLLRSMMADAEHQAHTVMVDNDSIRDGMKVFQDQMQENVASGLTPREADSKAWDKWQAASVYATQVILNRAYTDGFDIMRCGPIGNRITREIYNRTKSAGSRIETIILYAPLSTCKESTEKRWAAGGHPTREDYLLHSFEIIPDALPVIASKSDNIKYYLRFQVDQVPSLVAEKDDNGKFIQLDADGLSALKKALRNDNPDMDLTFLESNSKGRAGIKEHDRGFLKR